MENAEDNYVEPQVENAARILESKGYKIGTLAGQAGRVGEGKQAIVFEYPRKTPGSNQFDEKTTEALNAVGITQYSGGHPVDVIGLEFQAPVDDEKKVKGMWDKLAEILPEVSPEK